MVPGLYFQLRHPVKLFLLLDVPGFSNQFVAFSLSTVMRLLSNEIQVHVAGSGKPTFLTDGSHSYKVWHRMIFQSSKQSENPEIRKAKVVAPCALLISSFFYFKAICRTRLPSYTVLHPCFIEVQQIPFRSFSHETIAVPNGFFYKHRPV